MRRHAIHLIYAAGFVLAFSLALTAYVTSTFISDLIGKNYVGIIYSVSAVITLISYFIYPKILKKFGEKKIILSTVAINILTLVVLTFCSGNILLITTAVIYMATQSILLYLFDLLVAHFTVQKDIGKSRGKYISITSIAWVISPFLAGNIITLYGINAIFGIASIAVFIVYLMLHKELELVKPIAVSKIKIEELPKKNRRNIILVIAVNFFLQFFFTWMIIYSPIYLHDTLGVAWQSIGIIFTIMLLPFVLIEYPLGVFADKHGERLALTIGFIITALATLWFANNHSNTIFVLALILLLTRIGASTIEIMSETYFFKLVTEADAGVISLFRNMRSLAYIIGPLSATLVISLFSIKSLFSILAIIMIFSSLCAFMLTEKPRITVK